MFVEFNSFDFEAPEEKVKPQWCLPEEYQVLQQPAGWFMRHEESSYPYPPELSYFRSIYLQPDLTTDRNNVTKKVDSASTISRIVDADEQLRLWCTSGHKGHSRFQANMMTAQLALNKPTITTAEMDLLIAAAEATMVLPGDQMQVWELQMKVAMRFEKSLSELLTTAILLITKHPADADRWFDIARCGRKLPLHLSLYAIARAVNLLDYEIDNGYGAGFARESLEVQARHWKEYLAAEYAADMVRLALEDMSLKKERVYARSSDKEEMDSRPVHDRRDKDSGIVPPEDYQRIVADFKARFPVMFRDDQLQN
ncbi:unnamed protein product, partial [Mesorhabditis spiculigera]